MNFGWAQEAMERGESVKREAWNRYASTPHEYASVALVAPADGYEPLYIVTRHDGRRTMFNVSHATLRATDWMLA